jgi:hypothetical protein
MTALQTVEDGTKTKSNDKRTWMAERAGLLHILGHPCTSWLGAPVTVITTLLTPRHNRWACMRQTAKLRRRQYIAMRENLASWRDPTPGTGVSGRGLWASNSGLRHRSQVEHKGRQMRAGP